MKKLLLTLIIILITGYCFAHNKEAKEVTSLVIYSCYFVIFLIVAFFGFVIFILIKMAINAKIDDYDFEDHIMM